MGVGVGVRGGSLSAVHPVILEETANQTVTFPETWV